MSLFKLEILLRTWAETTTPHWTANRTNVIMIGPITNVVSGVNSQIVCDMDDTLASQYGAPGPEDFIMFSKDNKVNLSSLLGYYSEVEFRNNSQDEAELFSVATDFIESSK
jgi:hypothetical protein